MMRSSSTGVLASIVLLGGCGVSSPPVGSDSVGASTAPSLNSTGAVARPALGAHFEAASIPVAAGSNCTLRQAALPAIPGDLRLTADDDGVARFYAARPQKPGDLDALALDCVSSSGATNTYPIDLRAAETFAPRPFDAAKAGLDYRPGLQGDPSQFSTEELMAKGYGLRPDAALNPNGYARWLAAARKGSYELRSSGAPNWVSSPARPRLGAASHSRPPINATTVHEDGQPWTGALLTGSFAPNSDPNLTQSYLIVEATFVVPSITANRYSTDNTAITIWPGLDNVFQVIVDVLTGPNSTAVTYLIHRQMFATNLNGAGETEGVNFSPSANDTIYAEVWYCDANGKPDLSGGYACSYLDDETAGQYWQCSQASGTSCRSYQMGSTVNGESSLGQWAEFVVENDSIQFSSNNDWPDFAPIQMAGDATVVTGDNTWVGTATTTTDPFVHIMDDWTETTNPSNLTVSLPDSDSVLWSLTIH